MPVLIKDFSWSQTSEHILITVPLKSARTRPNVDLFVHPTFVKINAPPYLFEAFLADEIDATASKAATRIHENEIRFRLLKASAGSEWPSLQRPVAGAATVDAKQQIVQTAHELAAAEDKRRAKRMHDLRQAEISKEIGREAAVRDAVQTLHKSACTHEMAAVESLRTAPKPSRIKPTPAIVRAIKPAPAEPKPTAAPIPAVRQAATIGVRFSERRFPTPMRESQAHTEQEWLVKQNEARRATGFVEEDLRPEERNVDWLKAKGCDFFAKGNHLAAISAFSTAIRLNPQCYDLYVNRASCQYAMQNWNRCVSA